MTSAQRLVIEQPVCAGACIGMGIAFALSIGAAAALCWRVGCFRSECSPVTPQLPAHRDDKTNSTNSSIHSGLVWPVVEGKPPALGCSGPGAEAQRQQVVFTSSLPADPTLTPNTPARGREVCPRNNYCCASWCVSSSEPGLPHPVPRLQPGYSKPAACTIEPGRPAGGSR